MMNEAGGHAEKYTANDPCSLIKAAEVLGFQDPLSAVMLLKYSLDVLQKRMEGLFQREKEILSEELYKNPDNPTLLLRLAALSESSGKPAEAVEVYEKIVRLHGTTSEAAMSHDKVTSPEELDDVVNRLSSREAQLVCFAAGQKELLQKRLAANA